MAKKDRLTTSIVDELRKQMGDMLEEKPPVKNNKKESTPPPTPKKEVSYETVKYEYKDSVFDAYKDLEEDKERAEQIRNNLYDTNVLYTFGYSGSSKTTVIAMLNEYIGRNYSTLFNSDIDPEGARLMKHSTTMVKNRKFPPATPVNKVFEYNIEIKTHAMKDFLPLTFIEMSGEMFRKVSLEYQSKLPVLAEAYISNDDVPILYFLVVGYTDLLKIADDVKNGIINPEKDQDYLMSEFINYLTTNEYNTDNVALIISKFDKNQTDGVTLEKVVKEHLPRTYQLLTDSQIVRNLKIFDFSVGTVTQIENDGKYIDKIDELDFQDCERIVNWMWQIFDDRNIKPKERGTGTKKNSYLNINWWKKLFTRR